MSTPAVAADATPTRTAVATTPVGTPATDTTAHSPSARLVSHARVPRAADILFGRALSTGPMSSVFHCVHKEWPGVPFAAKVIHKQTAQLGHTADLVLNERHILARTRHRNIARLAFTLNEPHHVLLVMELCPRGSVAKTIARFAAQAQKALDARDHSRAAELAHSHLPTAGGCPLSVCRYYVAQVTSALAYLHSLGIVHCAVHPRNVLIADDGSVRLVDFALSQQRGESKTSGAAGETGEDLGKRADIGSGDKGGGRCAGVAGTGTGAASAVDAEGAAADLVALAGRPDYCAPEVLMGHPITPAADLWSLGCMLFHVITGVAPFKARHAYFTMQQVLNYPHAFTLEFGPQFPPAAKELVQALLEPDPIARLGAGPPGSANSMTRLLTHPFFAATPLIAPYVPPLVSSLGGSGSASRGGAVAATPWSHIAAKVWHMVASGAASAKSAESSEAANLGGSHGHGSGRGAAARSGDAVTGLTASSGAGAASGIATADAIAMAGTTRVDPELSMGDGADIEEYGASSGTGAEHDAARSFSIVEGNEYWRAHLRDSELVLFHGLVIKRKGLMSKKREMILTSWPRIVYFDPTNQQLKGEIPWSARVRVHLKDHAVFDVHTPGRVYHLTDCEGDAHRWRDAIHQLLRSNASAAAKRL